MRLIQKNSHFRLGRDQHIPAVALAKGLILPVERIQGPSYGPNLTSWRKAFSALGLVDAALTFFTPSESQGVAVPDRRRIARHDPPNQGSRGAPRPERRHKIVTKTGRCHSS